MSRQGRRLPRHAPRVTRGTGEELDARRLSLGSEESDPATEVEVPLTDADANTGKFWASFEPVSMSPTSLRVTPKTSGGPPGSIRSIPSPATIHVWQLGARDGVAQDRVAPGRRAESVAGEDNHTGAVHANEGVARPCRNASNRVIRTVNRDSEADVRIWMSDERVPLHDVATRGHTDRDWEDGLARIDSRCGSQPSPR